MRRRPRDRDVSSDEDDVSSDVSGSSLRRRHDDDSDVPRFFYGRASDTVVATGDRGKQPQTDDVSTPRASRDTAINGMVSQMF